MKVTNCNCEFLRIVSDMEASLAVYETTAIICVHNNFSVIRNLSLTNSVQILTPSYLFWILLVFSSFYAQDFLVACLL
jgi:hypothetical protein